MTIQRSLRLLLLSAPLWCFAQTTLPTYTVNTLAGSVAISHRGPAASAILRWPRALTFDAAGNLYVVDGGNASIRKVTPDGMITTIAGTGTTGFGGDGGPACQAQLSADLVGLSVDSGGNIYIVDSGNNRIRMISAADGTINTVLDGAQLPQPETQFGFTGMAFDAAGNLYIADGGHSQVYRIATDGTFAVIAGTGTYADNGDGGPATQAALKFPWGLYVDASGTIYVSDPDANRIRSITPDGMINAFAGTGKEGFAGDGGPALAALLAAPYFMAPDGNGNLYFLDAANLRVRRIAGDGTISTVAGSGASGFGGNGGPAILAQFAELNGLALSAAGDLYLSDWDSAIRVVTAADGMIQAAYGQPHFTGDGALASGAVFNYPLAFASDGRGNFYLGDNFTIRKIDSTGVLSTIAGNGSVGNTGDGGPATAASIYRAGSVTTDPAGNIYLGSGDTVRRIDTTGTITTVAGGGSSPTGDGDGGAATAANLSGPLYGLAIDSSNLLYIADTNKHLIRRVNAKGTISAFAGNGKSGNSGDGGPATSAEIGVPIGLVFDKAGNLYFADNEASRVRKISPNGTISAFAGTGVAGTSGDGGPATQAQLRYPWGLASDAAGNIYIADNGGFSVRVVTTDGIIHTVASGNLVDEYSGASFSGDGGPAIGADYSGFPAIAIDGSGKIYLLDSSNERIRVLTPNQQ